MNGKSQVEDFKELEVDASGNFTASLDRKDAQADKAAAILKDGGVNRALAKEVYPQYASQIDTKNHIQIYPLGINNEYFQGKLTDSMFFALAHRNWPLCNK